MYQLRTVLYYNSKNEKSKLQKYDVIEEKTKSDKNAFSKKLPSRQEQTPDEDRAARRILKIIRRCGKCNLGKISVCVSHTGLTAADRMRIITAMVAAGILQCSGLPGQRGETFWI